MKEEWRDIKGYEGLYQVSNLGKVKSLDHYASNGVTDVLYKGRIIKQFSHNGYMHLHLCKNNKVKTVNVHRLVAIAFIPNPFQKTQVNHIDGNKANNDSSNLEWCSQRENVIHGVKTGLRRLKIPRDKFKYIYDEHLNGKSYRMLADEFCVGKTRIAQIIKGFKDEEI